MPRAADMRAVPDGEGDVHGLSARAYAKINMSLEILGKRPDGFHELVSVSQTISLADHVTVWPAHGLHLTTQPPVIDDHDNLVWRAAEALALATGRPATGNVLLTKQIPLAAGLGGGSSDAATTLRLLDRLWGTQLDDARLADICATLGSDVSLFLDGGTSLMRGRGEQVESLPALQPFWLVLVCPGGAPPDKTRALYRALSPDEWSDGAATMRLADHLRAGNTIATLPLVNAFDGPADRVYTGFPSLRRRLTDLIGAPVHLTGAGPTLFALYASAEAARTAARAVVRAGITAHFARSIARRPTIRASHASFSRFSQ
jgi:4-diphosphocytidyl-2-C-methyl-D-erythritol kinase